MRIALLLIAFHTLAAEEPWGQDADLLLPRKEIVRQGPLSKVGSAMIHFYQQVISPSNGPRSHLYPTSSQYTKEAIQEWGLLRGIPIGMDRLMRENSDPWIYPTIHRAGAWRRHDPIPKQQ